ncbi:MAG TPA: DUF4440 domain-containing protein [Puia sp.]|nr:DUF4440 domain-containing protein [Puia sp.]
MRKIFYILLLATLTQFVRGQKNKQQDITTIKAARISSNKFISQHDVEGMSQFLMDDFVQVKGNAQHQTGKDSVVASWKKFFAANPKVSYIRNPTEIIISENDSLAWETGKWIGINSYSKGGNYSAMWRKSNNKWKIQAELFVSLND